MNSPSASPPSSDSSSPTSPPNKKRVLPGWMENRNSKLSNNQKIWTIRNKENSPPLASEGSPKTTIKSEAEDGRKNRKPVIKMKDLDALRDLCNRFKETEEEDDLHSKFQEEVSKYSIAVLRTLLKEEGKYQGSKSNNKEGLITFFVDQMDIERNRRRLRNLTSTTAMKPLPPKPSKIMKDSIPNTNTSSRPRTTTISTSKKESPVYLNAAFLHLEHASDDDAFLDPSPSTSPDTSNNKTTALKVNKESFHDTSPNCSTTKDNNPTNPRPLQVPIKSEPKRSSIAEDEPLSEPEDKLTRKTKPKSTIRHNNPKSQHTNISTTNRNNNNNNNNNNNTPHIINNPLNSPSPTKGKSPHTPPTNNNNNNPINLLSPPPNHTATSPISPSNLPLEKLLTRVLHNESTAPSPATYFKQVLRKDSTSTTTSKTNNNNNNTITTNPNQSPDQWGSDWIHENEIVTATVDEERDDPIRNNNPGTTTTDTTPIASTSSTPTNPTTIKEEPLSSNLRVGEEDRRIVTAKIKREPNRDYHYQYQSPRSQQKSRRQLLRKPSEIKQEKNGNYDEASDGYEYYSLNDRPNPLHNDNKNANKNNNNSNNNHEDHGSNNNNDDNSYSPPLQLSFDIEPTVAQSLSLADHWVKKDRNANTSFVNLADSSEETEGEDQVTGEQVIYQKDNENYISGNDDEEGSPDTTRSGILRRSPIVITTSTPSKKTTRTIHSNSNNTTPSTTTTPSPIFSSRYSRDNSASAKDELYCPLCNRSLPFFPQCKEDPNVIISVHIDQGCPANKTPTNSSSHSREQQEQQFPNPNLLSPPSISRKNHNRNRGKNSNNNNKSKKQSTSKKSKGKREANSSFSSSPSSASSPEHVFSWNAPRSVN